MHFTLDLSKPHQKLRNIIPDMEYDWCFNKKLATKGECQNSCKEKGDGWNLAVIPTQRHNQEVLTSYHLATSENEIRSLIMIIIASNIFVIFIAFAVLIKIVN